jgi:hypothetical protein
MFRYFHNNRYDKLLLQYAEDLLDTELKDEVESHISKCKRCKEKLGNIEFCNKAFQVGSINPENNNSEILWNRIRMKIEAADPKRHSGFYRKPLPRIVFKPVFIGVSLLIFLIAISIWSDLLNPDPSGERNITQQAGVAFDLGYYLDLKDIPDKQEEFNNIFKVKTVGINEINRHPNFTTDCYKILKQTCSVDNARLLTSNGNECLEISSSINGKPFTVLQQGSGIDWSFGKYTIGKKYISGVECFIVKYGNTTAVNWKGKSGNYMIVGNLSESEIEKIVLWL